MTLVDGAKRIYFIQAWARYALEYSGEIQNLMKIAQEFFASKNEILDFPRIIDRIQ